jgi:hypothetical protein
MALLVCIPLPSNDLAFNPNSVFAAEVLVRNDVSRSLLPNEVGLVLLAPLSMELNEECILRSASKLAPLVD